MERREYIQMTPIELNGELGQVFELLPASSIKFDKNSGLIPIPRQIARSISQRENSELFQTLSERVIDLFEHSHLLPAVKQLALNDFSLSFGLGIGKTDSDEDSLYNLFGLNSKSGGMFNPDEAQEINQRIIQN